MRRTSEGRSYSLRSGEQKQSQADFMPFYRAYHTFKITKLELELPSELPCKKNPRPVATSIYLLLMVLLQHFVSSLSDSLMVRSFLFRAAWAPPWSPPPPHFGFPRLFSSEEEDFLLHSRCGGDPGRCRWRWWSLLQMERECARHSLWEYNSNAG